MPLRSNTASPAPTSDFVVVMMVDLFLSFAGEIQIAGSSPSPPFAAVSYVAETPIQEQSGPAHGGVQRHSLGPMQDPFDEQALAHVDVLHCGPVKPAKQESVPFELVKPFWVGDGCGEFGFRGVYDVFSFKGSCWNAGSSEAVPYPVPRSDSMAKLTRPYGYCVELAWRIDRPEISMSSAPVIDREPLSCRSGV